MINAIKASGAIVRVEAKEFSAILAKTKTPYQVKSDWFA